MHDSQRVVAFRRISCRDSHYSHLFIKSPRQQAWLPNYGVAENDSTLRHRAEAAWISDTLAEVYDSIAASHLKFTDLKIIQDSQFISEGQASSRENSGSRRGHSSDLNSYSVGARVSAGCRMRTT